MHTLKLLILDPQGMAGGYRFERLVDVIAAVVSRLPSWRSRVVPAPMGLDHPRWEADPSFDVHDHVQRVLLTARGDSAALDRVISDVLSVPLPRDRPLWHITVVEGLADGKVALVMKIHHALADGTAFARILRSITSTARRPVLPPVPASKIEQPAAVSGVRMLGIGLLALVRRIARFPWLFLWTVMGDSRRRKLRRRTGERAAFLFRGPATPMNRPLTPRRELARVCLPFEDLELVKEAFGTTLNDVVLEVVADALRAWMERGDLGTSRPLVAGVPISAETDRDAERRLGNKVAHFAVPLHTDLDDPVERLQAIHRSASAAKAEVDALGRDLLLRWSELANRSSMRLLWRVVPHLPRPPINVIVSNVPGPGNPLYLAGAEVVDLYSVGPLVEGVGLNVTAWSYRDRLAIGVLTCPDLLSDPRSITDGIRLALRRLVGRALLEAA